MHPEPSILVLTGASGAGKTTLVAARPIAVAVEELVRTVVGAGE
jgi:predicted ATPase